VNSIATILLCWESRTVRQKQHGSYKVPLSDRNTDGPIDCGLARAKNKLVGDAVLLYTATAKPAVLLRSSWLPARCRTPKDRATVQAAYRVSREL
jgi:hypothetical protein